VPINRLKNLRVREVSLVDKGAGKGVRIVLFKRRAEDVADGGAVEFRVPFEKVDNDKRQVFGWAYVSDLGGGQVVDHDKQIIEPDDLEAAAYDFSLSSRKGGEMHERTKPDDPRTTIQKSRLIESFVTTLSKQRAMFNAPDLRSPVIPIGWWVGFQVDDDDTWSKVKNGELAEFSIAGSADAYEVAAARKPDTKQENTMPVPAVAAAVYAKVRGFLGIVDVKKDMGDYPMPQTVGQILDGREMREEMYELSDALMCSVSDITWSMIAPADKVSLLKQSVDEFSTRVEAAMSSMGEVEKRRARDALQAAEDTIASLEEGDEQTAKAEIQKRRTDFEKSKTPAAKTTPATTTQENTMPQATTPPARTLEDILKSLPEGERATVAAALKDKPSATTSTAQASAEPAANPIGDFLKSAPPELRGWFEKQTAENVELKKRLDATTLEIEKAKDDAVLEKCREIAKGYKGLLGSDDAVGELALTIKGLGIESVGAKALIKSMDMAFAKTREAENVLTAEIGTSRRPKDPVAGSADAKLTEIAKSLQDEAQKAGKPISFEKARTEAMQRNPRLYKQLTREHKAGVIAKGGAVLADDLPGEDAGE
jgi:hypothetical protein